MTETNDIAVSAGSQHQTEGTTTSSREKELKDAYNYIVVGKRHLLVQDYNAAVISLEEATRIFDQLYGVGGDECGDAYLHYGSALLELSRQETGALDGGVVGANIHESSEEEEDDDDDDDDDDEEQNGTEAPAATEAEKSAITNGKENGHNGQSMSLANDEDIENSDNDVKTATKAAHAEPVGSASSSVAASSASHTEPRPSNSAGPSTAEPVAGTSSGLTSTEGETDDLDAEDAEATSAEVAWEVLNLARDVFGKQIDKGAEYKLKLAESLQKLGEISIEWENYANAIDLLEEALSHRKEVLPEDDRIIAETYYHIGVSFSFSNEFERANDCYQSAVDVIESRLQNLRKFVAETAEATEEKSQKELEILELEGLLPEMKGKIEDSKDQMNQAMQQNNTEQVKDEEPAPKLNEASTKPVNNITHLVKRKRESSGEDDQASTKKVPPAPGGDPQPVTNEAAQSTPTTTA